MDAAEDRAVQVDAAVSNRRQAFDASIRNDSRHDSESSPPRMHGIATTPVAVTKVADQVDPGIGISTDMT
ncbi:MAG: hypothetical protein KDH15_12350 [Rhodocyclaceae bacterium]|nr:hypothetical protein [Rhodocyclaceae bacterium]